MQSKPSDKEVNCVARLRRHCPCDLNRLTDPFLLNGEYLVIGRMLEQQLASASRARELVSMHLRCKDWRCPGEIFYRHKLRHL